MTDPVDSDAQKSASRSRPSSTTGSGTPAGSTPPTGSAAPSGSTSGARPSTTPSPKSAASTSGGSGTTGASNGAAQIGGAVTGAMSQVRARLHYGEQLALVGAGLVVLVWLLFSVILDKFTGFNEVALVAAILLVLAIWVHRWGHHDFGSGYRVIVAALGLVLAIFAIANFLAFLRVIGGADALGFLGRIAYWAGGIIAGYGGWVVWRTGR